MLVLRDSWALARAPITDFVAADLRLPTPDSPVPTLRMLATMSGGLPSGDPWADRQEALTDAEFDEVLRAGVQFAWVPGTTFAYSNLGYALLGRALQVAAGRRFHDLVLDEIVVPLGLGATAFTSDVAAADGVAIGHQRVDGAWVPLPFSGAARLTDRRAVQHRDRSGAMGPVLRRCPARCDAGPLSAAAAGRCNRATADPAGSEGPDRTRRRRLRIRPRRRPRPRPRRRRVHAGEYPGFSAHIGWHPATGIGVVVLKNATYAGVSRVAAAALRDLLAATEAGPAWAPWPATLAAQASVMRLLGEWDDAIAAELFSDNGSLDQPFARRRAGIANVVARAGTLAEVDQERGDGPAHRSWRHRRARRRALHDHHDPAPPPRVQTFEVRLKQRARRRPAGGSPGPR